MYTSARKDWWYSSLSQSSYKSLSFMNPSLLGNSFSNRIVLRGILSLLLNAIAKAMVHKTNFGGFEHFHQPIVYPKCRSTLSLKLYGTSLRLLEIGLFYVLRYRVDFVEHDAILGIIL